MKKIKIDELNAGLADFFPDLAGENTEISVCIGVDKSKELESSGLGDSNFDQYSGKISGTPKNSTISSLDPVCEGGSDITEPNAGITSDMVKRDDSCEKTRWSINAYPNNDKKITPELK